MAIHELVVSGGATLRELVKGALFEPDLFLHSLGPRLDGGQRLKSLARCTFLRGDLAVRVFLGFALKVFVLALGHDVGIIYHKIFNR